jgi:hypothetical protein
MIPGMRQVAIAVLVLVGCGKGSKAEETGRICFAANPREAFAWNDGTQDVDYLADKPTAIRFRKQSIEQPGAEVAIADAREGEVVEVVRDGKVADSFRITFKKLGKDLCYFFRPYRDMQHTARWVLDSNREISRCHCFPIPPSGSGSATAPGSGTAAAPSAR